ncbi:MAG: hypothetical protein NTV43_17510 [Methylococcales bacterium]|nr:hypothetical protein [Methylococcales bacterium]
MPLFIALSLGLCFMAQTASPLQTALITPITITIGLALALSSLVGSLLKKRVDVWYDIFASGVLLVWFAYWKPLFTLHTPIFFFFPLYFAVMTALVGLFFIGQRDKIDQESLGFMRILDNKTLIQPWVFMLAILGSLELHQHFLLYPTLMTLLIMRFALASCVQGRSA